MFIHDVIKIRYIDQGYLPNYPYHLISDEDMFEAFRKLEYSQDATGDTFSPSFEGFFWVNYSNPDEADLELSTAHAKLVTAIQYHIDQYLETKGAYSIPDWVYSYMLGAVIGPTSDIKDIHDLILPLGTDNVDDVFDAASAKACLKESKEWIRRKLLAQTVTIESTGAVIDLRPPTMFGEPHVVKSIRLKRSAPELAVNNN